MFKFRYGQFGKQSGGKRQTRLLVSKPAELMKFLIEEMPDKTRTNIKSLLTHRQVLVGDKIVTQYNHPLRVGQEVIINLSLVRAEEQSKGIKIIYEDKEIIVIDKPAGLLSIASEDEKQYTAYHQLTDYVRRSDPENRIFIVHRLDRDTSGVMLFAKTEKVKRLLQDAWKETLVDRAYIAIVEGAVEKNAGSITSWLKETKTKLMYSSSKNEDGLKATTNYRVLQSSDGYSMLEIRLETGRKNQIRVHMKDIGHSVVGDKKYGSTTNPIKRLGLHAYILSFKHPVTGKLLNFETEVPRKFSRLFQ